MARPQCDTPLVSLFNCAESAWMANLKQYFAQFVRTLFFNFVTPVSWQATTHFVKVLPKKLYDWKTTR